MRIVKPIVFCVALAGAPFLASAALAEGGEGHGGGEHGGGGGGPAPLLGLTLLGQFGGAAGIFAAWRKRRRDDGQE